ncbi:MAG: discoidin domain-containing protein [Sedimentisphaerales bacterium]|nr:discoidin domain-containing protein [Sedimentisphaerales bacterium]
MKKLLILLLVTCLGLLSVPLHAEKIRVEVWDNDDGTAKDSWSVADRLNYYVNLSVDPALTFYQSNFSVGSYSGTDNYTLRQTAYINITQAGDYFFETGSDDGSNLWIGNWWDYLSTGIDPMVWYSTFADDVVNFPLTEVVMNDYYQGVTWRGGTIYLEPGVYGIMVSFYEGGGGDSVEVRYTKPGAGNAVSLENDLMDLEVWWPEPVQPTINLVDYEIWYQVNTENGDTSGFNSTAYTSLGYDNTGFPPLDIVLSIEGDPDATGSVDGFTLDGVALPDPAEYFVTRHRGIFKLDEAMSLGLGTDSDDGSLLFVGPWWEENPEMVLVADNDGLHGNSHWRGGFLEDVEAGYIGIETWMYEHAGGEYLAAAYWTTGVPRTLLNNDSLVSRAYASGPSPANGALRVSPDAILSWTAPVGTSDPEMFVYFGEYGATMTQVAPDTETSYDPDLKSGAVYHWRIDVLDPNENPWGNVPTLLTGSTWTFATAGSDITILQSPAAIIAVDYMADVTLSVEVTSALPLSYQWKKGGENITGATEASYVIPTMEKDENGIYSCMVTNDDDSVETPGSRVFVKELMAYWPLDSDLQDWAEIVTAPELALAVGDKDAIYMVNDPNLFDDNVPDMTVPFITGKVGNAVDFNGQTNFAYAGTWNPTADSGQMTVEFWAKWKGSAGHWEGPIGKRDSWDPVNMMWQIELDEDNDDVLKTLQSNGGGGGAQTVRLPEAGTYNVAAGAYISYSAQHTSNVDEEAFRGFDGQKDTKWLAFFNTAWLQVTFPDKKTYVVTSYAITSGNDADGRDPDNWTLQGSNDGTNWDILDTKTSSAGSWTARNQTVAFDLSSNTTAYRMYKLDITKARDPSLNILQLSEVELFAAAPIADDGWVFVTTTYDGTTATTYVNGHPVRSAAMTFAGDTESSVVFGGCEANPTGGSDVSSKPWGGNLFNGALDEVKIYNYALSEVEVLQNYYTMADGDPVCFPGTEPALDQDGNCVVDMADLLSLVSQWMQNNFVD